MSDEKEYLKFDRLLLELQILLDCYKTARIRNNGEYREYKKDIIKFIRLKFKKEKK